MENKHLQVMLSHFSIIKIDLSNYEKKGEYSFNPDSALKKND